MEQRYRSGKKLVSLHFMNWCMQHITVTFSVCDIKHCLLLTNPHHSVASEISHSSASPISSSFRTALRLLHLLPVLTIRYGIASLFIQSVQRVSPSPVGQQSSISPTYSLLYTYPTGPMSSNIFLHRWIIEILYHVCISDDHYISSL